MLVRVWKMQLKGLFTWFSVKNGISMSSLYVSCHLQGPLHTNTRSSVSLWRLLPWNKQSSLLTWTTTGSSDCLPVSKTLTQSQPFNFLIPFSLYFHFSPLASTLSANWNDLIRLNNPSAMLIDLRMGSDLTGCLVCTGPDPRHLPFFWTSFCLQLRVRLMGRDTRREEEKTQ